MSTTTQSERRLSKPRSFYLRISAAAVVFLALLVAAYWIGYPYYHRWQQLEQAGSFLDTLEVEDAEAILKDVAAHWPEHAQTQFLLGKVYRLMERFADAHRHLQEAERFAWPRAQLDLEYLLLEIEESGQEAPETRELVKRLVANRGPEEAPLYHALSIAAGRMHRLDQEGMWLLTWVQRFPEDGRAHYVFGIFLNAVGQRDLAQGEFAKTVELQPQSLLAHRWLGILMVKNGRDFPEAIRHLELFLHAHPDVDAEVALAQAQAAAKQPETARATLKRLLERHPDNVSALVTLAQLELDDDHAKETLALLDRAEGLPCTECQDVAHRAELRARAYSFLGQLKEAEAAERRVKQIKEDFEALGVEWQAFLKDSSDLNRQRKIGLLYVKLGQGLAGLSFLDRVLANNPHDQEVHKALADHFSQFTDPQSQRLAALHRQYLENNEQ